MIPPDKWKWYGKAGHLIVGEDCRFHLTTEIGKYLVSTVGQYFPDFITRELIVKSEGKKLEGKGDYREADFLKKVGYVEIGHERLFETMVFKTNGKICSCGCGMPNINGNDLDSDGYNTVIQATKGHNKLCKKWAEKQ